MKQRKVAAVILALAVLAGLGFMAYRSYQEKYVRINQVRHERAVQSLDLSGQSLENPEVLKQFYDLKQLDLRGTKISAEEYENIRTWFPEAEILWDIPFQGVFYPMDTTELTVTTLTGEDLASLDYFAELKAVSGEECPDYRVLHDLRLQRPDLQVTYRVPAAGELYASDAKQLVLPGAETEALMEILPFFTELETVELTAPMAQIGDILALMEAMPEISFTWNLEVGGITVNEKTETLDLTGIPMTVEEMDAVLPYLLSLTYVDMTDCGISNEEMDALNRRYENTKIVWTVDLSDGFRIRTDSTYFMPAKFNYYPKDGDLYNLRYCTDIIMIDLGHKPISNIDFVAYMPHLKYLILAETNVRDLTALTGLTELVYLELFLTYKQDFTPLLTLTALEDLNLHYVDGDPNIIAQMTWLKNLWWNHTEKKRLTYAEQQMLREAIPGCNFNFTCQSSTNGGWRNLPNYYAQRDVAGMFYMK